MTTQSPTLASQATAELPKLPLPFTDICPVGWAYDQPCDDPMPDLYIACQMNAYGLACYEAGRASRAQSEWIRVEDERKPVGRKPILVAVQWMNHYEHEDGTPARQEGCDVTEGEYVPQHGDRSGYFDSYAGPYDHDGWGITHWQPLPAAPATLGETK
jgi:hypothetical protein